jgi:hypothetical protein
LLGHESSTRSSCGTTGTAAPQLELFELSIETETWTVSMLWSKLADKDAANTWLRQTLNTISQTI